MKKTEQNKPLADRMRPEALEEFFGQDHLVGKGKMLRTIIEGDRIPSMIFWGPPGSGKTTLARIIAAKTNAVFVNLSAVSSGVKEVRKVITQAIENKRFDEKDTILFLDEIHRFNKSQQDRLLPYVEDGTITLIGATTENPSFEVNSALLSRSRVFVLSALSLEDLQLMITNALTNSERGLGEKKIKIEEEDIIFLANLAAGDARSALNALELSTNITKANSDGFIVVTKETIKQAFQKSNLFYDKGGEEHYNIISALHKSMRGSDADAALYWMCRMLEGGEDPLYIARRLVRFASEDIGIANSFALEQAVAAYQACYTTGMPECGVNLAQAVVYMAKSKKSNALYTAYQKAQQDARNFPVEPVPLHLRNASTSLMKDIGYGEGYKYTPEFDNPEDAKQEFFPEKLRGKRYF